MMVGWVTKKYLDLHKGDIRRSGWSSPGSLSSSVMEEMLCLFCRVNVVLDEGGEHGRESDVDIAGGWLFLAGCETWAWQEWKSWTALCWKESLGVETLAVFLSFTVRLRARIGWGMSTCLMIINMDGKRLSSIHTGDVSALWWDVAVWAPQDPTESQSSWVLKGMILWDPCQVFPGRHGAGSHQHRNNPLWTIHQIVGWRSCVDYRIPQSS